MRRSALLPFCALTLSAAVRVPVAFEPNQGQWDSGHEFLAHAAGYSVSLHGGSAEFLFRGSRIRATMAGARASRPAAEQKLSFTSTYLVGPRSHWRRHVPVFGAVRYPGVYPGIDMRYYERAGNVEYDFEVAPGADPRRIRLDIAGARRLWLDPGGDLLIETETGTLRQKRPAAYQQFGGERREVAAAYVLRGNRVSLRLGKWDRGRTLVIDPELTWAGYTGTAQNTGYDDARSVAEDATGNVYVTGATVSTYGDDDVLVVKIDPNGKVLGRATLGGEGNDDGYAIAVDSTGAVYVVGSSDSVYYWQISGTYGGFGTDAFYVKIDPTFSSYVYAGFYGGGSTDVAYACALDAAGNLYFGGPTASTDLKISRSAPQTAEAGGWDGFLAKLDPSGNLLYGTYLGGSGNDYVYSIAVDAAGNIYTAGQTASTNLAVTSAALQNSAQGGADAFAARYGADGTLAWLTYLGGKGDDEATGIAVDASGAVVVTGGTASTDFPTAAPYQKASAGGARDIFVTKISADGSKLIWSTYLGGSGDDLANALALDAAGNIYVGGSSNSTDFPNTYGWQSANKGGADGTVSSLSADGSQLLFSSYLGGAATDYVNSLAVNCTAGLVVAGTTQSTNFPSTLGSAPGLAYSQGAAIGFVAKVATGSALPTIATGGIVNNFTGAAPVAPGSIVSLYGSSLAGAAGSAPSTPLPNTLNGVTVTINGATVPLFYVSPGQINFQLPFETTPGTASATVTSGCGTSPAVSFQVVSAAPYLVIQTNGDAVVQNQDYSLNSESNPAPKGTIVTVYLTGIGPLDKSVTTGAATPADYFNATLPAHALIGGFDTNIKFLGMTPGFVGLAQANLEVPNLSPGKYPVVITVNGVDSNAATMYVK